MAIGRVHRLRGLHLVAAGAGHHASRRAGRHRTGGCSGCVCRTRLAGHAGGAHRPGGSKPGGDIDASRACGLPDHLAQLRQPRRIGGRIGQQLEPILDGALAVARVGLAHAKEIAGAGIGAVLRGGLFKGGSGGRGHLPASFLHQHLAIGGLIADAIRLQRDGAGIGLGGIAIAPGLEIAPAQHAPAFRIIRIALHLLFKAGDQLGHFAISRGRGRPSGGGRGLCGGCRRAAGQFGLTHVGVERGGGHGHHGGHAQREARQGFLAHGAVQLGRDMPGGEQAAADFVAQPFRLSGLDAAGGQLHVHIGKLILQHGDGGGARVHPGFVAAHQRDGEPGGSQRRERGEDDPKRHDWVRFQLSRSSSARSASERGVSVVLAGRRRCQSRIPMPPRTSTANGPTHSSSVSPSTGGFSSTKLP